MGLPSSWSWEHSPSFNSGPELLEKVETWLWAKLLIIYTMKWPEAPVRRKMLEAVRVSCPNRQAPASDAQLCALRELGALPPASGSITRVSYLGASILCLSCALVLGVVRSHCTAPTPHV